MVEASVPTAEGAVKKKSYHHGDLRNAIIQEATARARRSGEKAIVLREIAPQIGVSATAAYRHFANRQQLVEEVSARGYAEMADRVIGPGFLEKFDDPALASYIDLRNAAVGIVEFAVAEPAWARMMIENMVSSELVAEQAERVRTFLQGIVEQGVEAGSFRADTRIEDQHALWVAIDGLSLHAMLGVRTMDTPEAERTTGRTIDLCMTDILTEEGCRLRDAAALGGGIVTELPG